MGKDNKKYLGLKASYKTDGDIKAIATIPIIQLKNGGNINIIGGY